MLKMFIYSQLKVSEQTTIATFADPDPFRIIGPLQFNIDERYQGMLLRESSGGIALTLFQQGLKPGLYQCLFHSIQPNFRAILSRVKERENLRLKTSTPKIRCLAKVSRMKENESICLLR